MAAALGPYMMRHPEVKNSVESFVMQFVTSEFGAQEGYLRAIVSFFLFWFCVEAVIILLMCGFLFYFIGM
jgi:hypothetical protein